EPPTSAAGVTVNVEMQLRDINTNRFITHLSLSSAYHAGHDPLVSVQASSKGRGDHTLGRSDATSALTIRPRHRPA
uniref:hypothetical protein n=1 Tax=Paracoccus sp. T5 TaxID=3402161 RepID=UPI003AE8C7B4